MNEKMNPTARGVRQGPKKSKQPAMISEPDTTKQLTPEGLAAIYIAQRFKCSMPVARTLAALAGLGGRLA